MIYASRFWAAVQRLSSGWLVAYGLVVGKAERQVIVIDLAFVESRGGGGGGGGSSGPLALRGDMVYR